MPRLAIDEQSLAVLSYGQGATMNSVSQLPSDVAALEGIGVGRSHAYRLGLVLLYALLEPRRGQRLAVCLAWLKAAFPTAEGLRTFAANLRYLAAQLEGVRE